jgi:hypothetical protein
MDSLLALSLEERGRRPDTGSHTSIAEHTVQMTKKRTALRTSIENPPPVCEDFLPMHLEYLHSFIAFTMTPQAESPDDQRREIGRHTIGPHRGN